MQQQCDFSDDGSQYLHESRLRFLLLFKSYMDIQFLQFLTVNSPAMGDQKLHVMSNNSLWWLDLVALS